MLNGIFGRNKFLLFLFSVRRMGNMTKLISKISPNPDNMDE